MKLLVHLVFVLFSQSVLAQTVFPYTVHLEEYTIDQLPALHSFSTARCGGKWLFIGGRTDGIHERMPMNAFPSFHNNTMMYVVDPGIKKVWQKSVQDLPVPLREHLQSGNPNYVQVEDTLYIAGGYAYSRSANGHITFPYLTTIQISKLITAIQEQRDISDCFKQVHDTMFAVTGGQMAYMNRRFYLIGGHRFDGVYNPEGQPSFMQRYTNHIRSMVIQNNRNQITVSDHRTLYDAMHLHRRDYNLIPYVTDDGQILYTISGGVFQYDVNKSFSYPVDIMHDSYKPYIAFNQYLNLYHSAHVACYDEITRQSHVLFFGGIGTAYPNNQKMLRDSMLPFVNSVSLLSRLSDTLFQERLLDVQLPDYLGTSSVFIHHEEVPRYTSDMIMLSHNTKDTMLIGYLYGGIRSKTKHPFFENESRQQTGASNRLFRVYLIQSDTAAQTIMDGSNPYLARTRLLQNGNKKQIELQAQRAGIIRYYGVNEKEEIIFFGQRQLKKSRQHRVSLRSFTQGTPGIHKLYLVFDDLFFTSLTVSAD